MIEQINQLKQGSIISESSHYIVNRVSGSSAWLTHFERVKIESLEAIRFNLSQEMADIIVWTWIYNRQIKSLELDQSISTPLNI